MKITKEWLEQEIAQCDKNIEYYNFKVFNSSDEWKELYYKETGKREGLEIVRFHKIMSNRSCVIFDLNVPQWKRNIIRFLRRICDWLEGVDDKHLFKRDMLEKRSDEARKRYRTKK